jgi:uncharacterized protein YjbJ (UPF0337 family)
MNIKSRGRSTRRREASKEGVGSAVGDRQTESEGKVDRVVGKVKEGYGDLKEKVKDKKE